MSVRLRDLYADDVRGLITHLTDFQEDEENFITTEKYVVSNLLYHRYLSVDSHAVRRSINGIVEKFLIHGHIQTAERLDELQKQFLSSEVLFEHRESDIQWSVLSLLLHLSENPTKNVTNTKTAVVVPEVKKEEDNFNWTSYLREGDESFYMDFTADSQSDELESLSLSESEEDEVIGTCLRSNTLETGPGPSVDGLESSDEVRTGIKHVHQCEMWLRKNIQPQRWIPHRRHHLVTSKAPSAHLSRLWDEVCGVRQQTQTMSEYKVMREIIRMFFCPTNMVLFQLNTDGKFVVSSDITVPTITKETFQGFLSELCPYMDMIRELHRFEEDVEAEKDPDNGAPRTYKVYLSVLKEFLLTFNSNIISIDTEIMQQQKIHTLIMLNYELKPWLVDLQCVFNLHKKATLFDWKTSPHWLCSSCLLSVLYVAVKDKSSDSAASFIFNMFLKSMWSYLDIIDRWLTDGSLMDMTGDFVISRSVVQADSSQTQWEDGIILHPYEKLLEEAGVTPLPLLKAIVNRVVDAGHSMELLLRLDRLGEMRSCTPSQGHLFDDLMEAVEAQLSGIVEGDEVGIVQTPSEQASENQFASVGPSSISLLSQVTSHHSRAPKVCVAHDNDRDRILALRPSELLSMVMPAREGVHSDPFLSLVYRGCASNNLKRGQAEELQLENRKQLIYNRLVSYYGHCPVLTLLHRELLRLLEAKQSVACRLLIGIVRDEMLLLQHLQVVQAVFLLEAGDLMHQFYSHVFKQLSSVHHGNTSSCSLTALLEDVLATRFPEQSRHLYVTMDLPSSGGSGLALIDCISIAYRVDWPLNLVFTSANVLQYNKVLGFLLKLKWGLWVLERLRFPQTESQPWMRRLQLLRHWLLEALGSAHTYFMAQVLQPLSCRLYSNVELAGDLSTVLRVHDEFVSGISNKCLFEQRGAQVLQHAILEFAVIAQSVAQAWNAETVLDIRLKEMEDTFIRCYYLQSIVFRNQMEQPSILPRATGS